MVVRGQELRLASAELVPMHAGGAVAEGELAPAVALSTVALPASERPLRSPWSASVALGLLDGAAKDALLAGGRFGVERSFGAKRLALTFAPARARAPGMRENRVTAEVMPSWWLGAGRLSAGLGAGLGAGHGNREGGQRWPDPLDRARLCQPDGTFGGPACQSIRDAGERRAAR